MKITELLNAEHGVFLAQLRYLEDQLDRRAHRAALAASTLTIAHAVEVHREVEEKLLYPALEAALGPASPVPVMLDEHAEIEMALSQVRSGRFDESVIRTFVFVLSQHIQKEIEILFPLAHEKLPGERLSELGRRAAEYVRDRADLHVKE
jgi:hemerythrin-like domain-containing protein